MEIREIHHVNSPKLATRNIIIAFITFTIVYVTINHLNVNDKKIIRIANKYGFIIILISSLGLVVTGCYPVGYTDVPNMLEWVMTVLGVHSLGAVMILVGVALYQYCLAAVWWYLPCASKREKYIKLFFICVYTAFFVTISYPLPKMVEEVMGPDVLNFERMRNTIYDLPRVYTISRLICSTTEYSICILSIVNFGFFYKYLQKVSLRIVLRHKSCTMEPEDPVPSIKLKPIS
ncbi:uncharacterized protein CEXT_109241 [Caerostris extrusa]|uniref:Uncharacterized protein n=1 Tax=Caerostris extrusa TaxID=172846 RepID=A0AAV4UH96_CAEEX|nr:uncharacterized protein CEXT_109241 [Caerostris extrusa]